jgi:predicted O-linked N-acetylglucosamine transferase (SPINDLY family)
VAWTTESKSLWLTLTAADPGHSFASRMGASLCAATGLEDPICPSPEAYQERAIALGHQPAELERLRRELLERHRELPLFNTAAWVGHLESLLERLLEGLLECQEVGSPGRPRAACRGGPGRA